METEDESRQIVRGTEWAGKSEMVQVAWNLEREVWLQGQGFGAAEKEFWGGLLMHSGETKGVQRVVWRT